MKQVWNKLGENKLKYCMSACVLVVDVNSPFNYLCIAPCKVILALLGFRIPLLGFRISLFGFWIPLLGLRIRQSSAKYLRQTPLPDFNVVL